jgi:hypothetical protein
MGWAQDSDPYGPVTARPGSVEALLQAAAKGEPGADVSLQHWFETHPAADAATRDEVAQRLCVDFGYHGWNAARRDVCTAETRPSLSGDDDAGLAEAFAKIPPTRAIGSATIALRWNPFGSQSGNVTVNGVTLPWLIDTGAEITVVSRSVADRIGVRYLGRGTKVGTTTADVNGDPGVIDLMTIGAARVENVPVLVLSDKQLTIFGGHVIPAILGLPVLVAFRRVAWLHGGETLALGESAPRPAPHSFALYWRYDGLTVPVATSLGTRGAQLDTGANNTIWWRGGISLLAPADLAATVENKVRIGGAGGLQEARRRHLKMLQFRFAGVPVELGGVDIDDGPQREPGAALIGMDTVSQLSTLILDFETMRVNARPKTPTQRRRSGWHALTWDDLKPAAAAPSAGASPKRDRNSPAPPAPPG